MSQAATKKWFALRAVLALVIVATLVYSLAGKWNLLIGFVQGLCILGVLATSVLDLRDQRRRRRK
jgi:hypothetical protein